MPIAVQIDDDAYAIAKAFAEQAHCSVASAVSTLVVKSGIQAVEASGNTPDPAIRFPLVKGARAITSEEVARLEDDS